MEKRENFKFSMRTVDNLKALIDMGLARNKTEAIDFALEHIVTEEKTKLTFGKQIMNNAPTGSLTEIMTLFGGNTESQSATA